MSVPLSVRSGGLLSSGAAASDDFDGEEVDKHVNVQVRLQDVTTIQSLCTQLGAVLAAGAGAAAADVTRPTVHVLSSLPLPQLEPATALGPSSLSPSPLHSPHSPTSPTAAADPDRVLRYFHAPHSYACSTVDAPSPIPSGGEHVACASCNPHGLKHSRPTSKLSVWKSNYISTTKYTLWNFIPRNLFEQFRKKANFYFLIIAILSFTPLSPKSPLPAVAPLVFVLAVTAIKEAVEDYRRYQQDVITNSTLVSVWRFDTWTDVSWANVRAGDIVRVLCDNYFPADLVLLQSSSNQGACSIETANLDGETNLKVKQAVPQTYELACGPDGLDYPQVFSAVLESDPPNDKMDANSWNGNLHALQTSAGQVAPTVPLGFSQLLLRGCRLVNTRWVVALVCFTGRETKLMLQAKSKEVKRSQIDRAVDKCLYLIFLFQAAACAVGAAGQFRWLDDGGKNLEYLRWGTDLDVGVFAFLSYFSYLVLMDILVPISLYVSMELVKFGQAYFINVDSAMRHRSVTEYGAEVDIPARARTSNLNEELGQIDFIFSDKTGTLTRNEMKFLRCTVGVKEYGPGCMSDAGEVLPRQAFASGLPAPRAQYAFEDNRLLRDLTVPAANKADHESAAEMRAVDEYLTLLATCHTVMLSYDGCDAAHVHNREGCTARTRFNAQSPDELALVEFAQEQQYFFHHIEPCKFDFRGRTIQGSRLWLNIRGEQHAFDVLEVLEFNSTRKRCSVVLYDNRDGQVKIYCKGADNVIRERLNPDSLATSWLHTNAHLQRFAAIGLRTLCCAYRVVPPEEFLEWHDLMQAAKSSMDGRAEAIASASELIEVGFELLGTTAIEDRLQEGVPEAIASLALAGIKLWVLTGDKVETAINIGRSCRLLTDAMRGDQLIVIDVDEALGDAEAMAETMEALAAAEAALSRPGLNTEQTAIVVSGKALGFVFPRRKLNKHNKEIIPPQKILDQEAALQMRFLHICTTCKAVICCRMSPKQKSQVVRLVKDNMKDKITLAIGDGANDVAMIEAAHVGIGIEGLEGKQAVMASDVSIGQFRFLNRLLLLHGGWSYRRISTLILYCFYKNITVALVQLWFGFYNGFSAQIFYDQVSSSLYNIFFTGMPVLLLALFNRDVSEEALLQFPQLYSAGQRNECFSTRMFIVVIFKGVCDSLLLFFFTIGALGVCADASGLDGDHWTMSTALFTATVLVVNLKVALETRTWTRWNALGLVLTVASWWVWVFILTASPALNPDTYGVMKRLVVMPNFWLLLALLPVTCMLPEIAIKYYRQTYHPDTAALGSLYLEYLIALTTRDRESAEAEARQGEEQATRCDQIERQETAVSLTAHASTGVGAGVGASATLQSRLSLMVGSDTCAAEMMQQAQAHSLESQAGGAMLDGEVMAGTPRLSPPDSWAADGAAAFIAPGAFSAPAHRAPLSRHTIAQGVPRSSLALPRLSEDEAMSGDGRVVASRSFDAMPAGGRRHTQSWQQLAKTIKQDNVGFTPFVSSEGEADFIMSGRTLRDLSLSHRNTRTFTITPGHAATDNAATNSSSSSS